MRAILAAFAYFSIFPVGAKRVREGPTAVSIAALPLVGAVVGALAGCGGLLAAAYLTPIIGCAIAFVLMVALSGAMHVDGFLDSCDALFASVAPSRRLEILKDPRHGTFAVAGMAIACVLSLAALIAYPPQRLPEVLAFTGALARACAVLTAVSYGYGDGARSPAWACALAFALLLAASFALAPFAWIAVVAAAAVALLLARWIASRLGGTLRGDSYGFIIVAIEVLLLLALTVLYRR